jgi:DNA-binding response OmpR family regulator
MPTILTIDDSHLVRQIVASALRALRVQLLEAGTGAEGFRLFVQHRPDLVLLDVVLPDTDGVVLLQQIRRIPDPVLAMTPVVVLTSVAERTTVEALLDAGATDYLLKPFTIEELRLRVRRALPAITA